MSLGVLRRRARLALFGLAAPLLGGCALSASGVRVEPLSVSTSRAGRVTALVAVSDRGKPVGELGAESFEVREAGAALAARAVALQVRPLAEASGHEAALLVDLGRPLTDLERAELQAPLQDFIERLRRLQSVTLYAFDGSKALTRVARYARDPSSAWGSLAKDPALARLLAFKPRDASASLNSALLEGRRLLEQSLDKSGQKDALGTLIVLSRGPDLAGRSDPKRAASDGRRSFLLKVGPWSADRSLDFIGRSGVLRAASFGTVGGALDELEHDVDEVYRSSYLVSYCSPARAGERRFEVVVRLDGSAAKPREGSAEASFDASGFKAGCAPARSPNVAANRPARSPVAKAPKPPGASTAPVAIAPPPAGLGYE